MSARVLGLTVALLLMGGCADQGTGELEEDAVGSTQSELFGSFCYGTNRYPEHGVYDTTLVYSIDETVPAGEEVFPPMDTERDTLAYRTTAYDFFRDRYGMNFDPNVVGDQLVVDGQGGQALVSAIQTGAPGSSTHQVYGLDAQHIPQWRHRLPITNTAFRDDGYFVFILTDFVANGSFGGAAGARIRAGDLVVAGEYRMFDHRDRLLDTIRYFADTPSTVNPFTGDAASSNGATFVNITCRVESDLFGEGVTRGIGEQRPNPDGSLTLDFRYLMRFPSILEQPGASFWDRCRNLRPLH
ncbi:MAG: hypothetical protein AAGF12_13545 [Myxococcota bacterium]